MTDVSNLDDLANAISQSGSPKIRAYAQAQAAATQAQETEIRALAGLVSGHTAAIGAHASRLAALEAQAHDHDPDPPPPPPPLAVPSVPSGLAATAGDGQVVLSWSANPAAESVDVYQVYRVGAPDVLDIVGTTYTVSGLANGTSYSFRISAHNAAGYGPYTGPPVSVTPQGAVVPPPPPPTTLGRGISYIKLGSGAMYSNREKYDTLILTRNVLPLTTTYGNRLLTYMSGTNVTDAAVQHYGVSQAEARANNWLLKSSSGAEIVNSGFPDARLGDVGDAGYQSRWAQNVEAMCAAAGVSGFYNDDCINWGRLMGFTGNVIPAKYPNATAWDNAMVSFCQAVGAYLRPRGVYVSHNCNAWLTNDDESNNGMRLARFWARVGPHSDGLMCESWMWLGGWSHKRLAGTAWWDNWDAYRQLHRFCNGEPFPVTGGSVQLAAPIDFIALDDVAADQALQRYCLGTFLLDHNRPLSTWVPTAAGDPWSPVLDNLPLGVWNGPATKTGDVWTRVGANGTVTVNPVAGTATIS